MRNAIGYSISNLFFSLIAVSVCHAGVEDLIASCAMHDSKDARIACLEAALRAGAAEAESPAPAETPAEVVAAGDRLPPAPSAEEGAQASRADAEAEAGDPPETQVTEAGAERVEAGSSGIDELGLEQVAAQTKRKVDAEAPVSATVVAFDFVGYRRLRVQLDNGQVWRQTDGDRPDLTTGLREERTFDVELWRTRLGGYRMRIAPLNQTIRVSRLK